ncbi:MAG: DNA replication and repair protein RecF [Verrucomicrobia bacterium]|nr:MAG: DNA replication and repair protein RecF [Verrucomicrobiota bacterium]
MLTSLRLRNFRCFEGVLIDIGPAFNLFLGANGEGKTTILEAACILLRLQSQRSSSLAPVIQIGKKFFEVRGKFEEHELEFRYSALRRRVKFDEIEQRTLSEYLRIGRVVSLANADIELVRGGSEARRRYLDFLGAQIDGSYRPALRAYERALRARNALLKSPMLRAREVAAYDAPLIEHGRVLLRLRAELTEMLAPLATQAYRRISAGRERFALRFLPGASSDDFGGDLGRSHSESIRLRQTIVGPHRDDLELLVDDLPAAQFASEGQQRTIVLAMKIAQADALKRSSDGKAPLLLIDDIFGELDPERRNALLDNLPADSQKLVTATAMPWRDEITADTIYQMCNRQLIRVKN